MAYSFKKTYKASTGYTPLCVTGECAFKKLEFGIIELAPNESLTFDTGEREVAFIVLSGRANFDMGDKTFDEVGLRKSVFGGKAHAVYCPRRKMVKISAVWAVKIAVCMTPIDCDTEAHHVTPDEVSTELWGQPTWERETHFIIGRDIGSKELFVGEAFVTPGNWAGFPPHKHDIFNMPEEDVQEELYYFMFQPEQGFGIQCIYTGDGSVDVAYRVKNDELVEFPMGYHTTVMAPGYNSYFLWVSSAVNPGVFRSTDPDHMWIHALENFCDKTKNKA
ncbi:MAG: 5-deoxy-glucuronate isomerase [Pyramidobacter sp.]|nr:5-deoxy-glucuronate isomerase [Pyramidobacter sp.]